MTNQPLPRNCDDFAPGSNARMTCLADNVDHHARKIDTHVAQLKVCVIIIVIAVLINLVLNSGAF